MILTYQNYLDFERTTQLAWLARWHPFAPKTTFNRWKPWYRGTLVIPAFLGMLRASRRLWGSVPCKPVAHRIFCILLQGVRVPNYNLVGTSIQAASNYRIPWKPQPSYETNWVRNLEGCSWKDIWKEFRVAPNILKRLQLLHLLPATLVQNSTVFPLLIGTSDYTSIKWYGHIYV